MSLSSLLKSELQGTTKTFEATMDNLSSTLEFLQVAEKVRPRIGGIVNWTAADPEVSALVRQYMGKRDTYSNYAHGPLIVIAYGTFEQFLRRFVEVCVSTLGAVVPSIDQFSSDFCREHIYRTGRAIASVKHPKSYLSFEHEVLGMNLGACRSGEHDYTLNASAIAAEIGPLTKENIDNYIQRLGIKINWDDVGRRKPIQSIVQENDVRKSTKAAIALLERIVFVRNGLAHTGSVAGGLTTAEAAQYLEFIKIVALAIGTVSSQRLVRQYGQFAQ